MNDAPKHLIHSRALPEADALVVRHPLDARTEVRMHPLSRAVGMQRAHVSLFRLAPGKRSFPPHAHLLQEEWVYILGGRGLARIGDREIEVGAGDFLGFPADGIAHTLDAVGEEDLVYLSGGESGDVEIARFPESGKLAIFEGDKVRLFDEAAAELRTVSDWIGKSR